MQRQGLIARKDFRKAWFHQRLTKYNTENLKYANYLMLYAMKFFLKNLLCTCFLKKAIQSEAIYFFLYLDVNEKKQYQYKTQ